MSEQLQKFDAGEFVKMSDGLGIHKEGTVGHRHVVSLVDHAYNEGRDEVIKQRDELLAASKALLKSLSINDDEGLMEQGEAVINLRIAIAKAEVI